jgi:hypothetical protein
MNHSGKAVPDNPDGAASGDPTRPLSAIAAIERIAMSHEVPKEVVEWEFWSAWDALLSDAKCTDYVLLLAEKRVKEALRCRRRQ